MSSVGSNTGEQLIEIHADQALKQLNYLQTALDASSLSKIMKEITVYHFNQFGTSLPLEGEVVEPGHRWYTAEWAENYQPTIFVVLERSFMNEVVQKEVEGTLQNVRRPNSAIRACLAALSYWWVVSHEAQGREARILLETLRPRSGALHILEKSLRRYYTIGHSHEPSLEHLADMMINKFSSDIQSKIMSIRQNWIDPMRTPDMRVLRNYLQDHLTAQDRTGSDNRRMLMIQGDDRVSQGIQQGATN